VETGLFLVAFYLYVWLVIDPRLIHHSIMSGLPFYYYPFSIHTGWPFFQELLEQRGGLVDYATRWLTLAYAFGWAGALIITAAAGCATVFTHALSARAGLPRGRVLCYVPAIIVLLMYGRFAHPLSLILSLLTSLGSFVLYVRLAPRAPIGRLATFLISWLVLIQIGGAGSLLYAVMVAIDELLLGGHKFVAAAVLACAGIVPWAAAMVFGVHPKETYGKFLAWAPGVLPGIWPLAIALALFYPTLLTVAVLRRARSPNCLPACQGPSHKSDVSLDEKPGRLVFGNISAKGLGTLVFFLGVAAAVWFAQDSLTQTVLEIDYHVQHARWAEVLRSAERMPGGVENYRCYRNTMLALYHLGRLGDDMFRFPQRPGTPLLYTPIMLRDMGNFYRDSQFFLELGFVNWAEWDAYEALVVSGDSPAVLEQLAIIIIAKNQPETARIFLRAMAKHPLEAQAARDLLQRVETDATLHNDPVLARIRANMVDKDSVASSFKGVEQSTGRFQLVFGDIDELFMHLLNRNPSNKMAFEMCMAFYLVEGRTDKVVANFPRLKDFSYAKVPRHFQEAWVIYHGATVHPPPIPGFELDPEVLERARSFQRITAQAAKPQEAASAACAAGLSDSYFFYFVFGYSGR
jgi:hypothetical protein